MDVVGVASSLKADITIWRALDKEKLKQNTGK